MGGGVYKDTVRNDIRGIDYENGTGIQPAHDCVQLLT